MLPVRRDWLGSIIGVLTFLGGVGLLVWTFQIAYGMFGRDPAEALGLAPGKPIDLNQTATVGLAILFRILLLTLMCIVASVVATRGIRLYGACRSIGAEPRPDPKESE